jgi:pyrroline-5-carboxylate reductase
MKGTAALITQGMEPAEVRAAVTSPGGTTAMAIRELERAGVRAGILNAVQAAFDRAGGLAGAEGK